MTFGVCGMRRRVGRQAAGGWCVSVSCVVCVGERGGSCGGGVRSGGVVEWWSEWYVVVVRSFEVGGRWRSFDSSGERKARTHNNTHTHRHTGSGYLLVLRYVGYVCMYLLYIVYTVQYSIV